MSTSSDEHTGDDGSDAAREEMRAFEERDEVPSDLDEWPDGKAKFLTFGHESDEPYGEGPTAKLGPGSLERGADGTVMIDGEQVDNPEDYRGDPIPGGPTDPDAERTPAEQQRFESR
jgi:hypothetical protein